MNKHDKRQHTSDEKLGLREGALLYHSSDFHKHVCVNVNLWQDIDVTCLDVHCFSKKEKKKLTHSHEILISSRQFLQVEKINSLSVFAGCVAKNFCVSLRYSNVKKIM